MRVLGLDPSLSSYGWCILETEGDGVLHLIDRGRFSTAPWEIEIKRYLHLRSCLNEVVSRYQPVCAGLETPYFGDQYSEGLYALFVLNQEVLYCNGIDTVYFAPSQLKKLTSGVAKSPAKKMFKSDMIEAAKKVTGVPRWNADEADAFHASRFGARFFHFVYGKFVEDDLTPVEWAVFINRHKFKRGKKAGTVEENGIFFKKHKRWFAFSKLNGVSNGF